jgi:hypothetical protein
MWELDRPSAPPPRSIADLSMGAVMHRYATEQLPRLHRVLLEGPAQRAQRGGGVRGGGGQEGEGGGMGLQVLPSAARAALQREQARAADIERR